jgi:LPXTG-site transpeptidase (sortase) family protein
MQKFFNTKIAAIFIGSILIVWSITSAFIDLRNAPPPLSPIDQLEDGATDVSSSIAIGKTGISPTDRLFSTATAPIQTTGQGIISPRTTPTPSLGLSSRVTRTAVPDFERGIAVEDRKTRIPKIPATATSTAAPSIPDRIVIPAIGLDAPIEPAAFRLLDVNGVEYQQWKAPNKFAAGWQTSSAALGVPGNTVLSGHHNIYGEVFGRLVDLQPGDQIELYSGEQLFTYEVTNKMILPEKGEPMDVRIDNARWLQASTDERITLITCYPHWTNTHRLIIVAAPISRQP